MMENKYYTPDIEDIRVGYEGEINWSRGYSETFVPFKITVQNEDFAYTGLLSEIVDAMDDGYAEVKTPYLTKEQIEAEGFTFKGKGVDDWYEMGIEKAFNTDLHNFSGYKAYNVFLQYGKHDNRLKIRGDFSGGAKMNEGEVLFDGECKSINELRQILKLIHITPFYKD